MKLGGPTLKFRLLSAMTLMCILLLLLGSGYIYSTAKIADRVVQIRETEYPLAFNCMHLELNVERVLATIGNAASAGRDELLTPLKNMEYPVNQHIAKIRQLTGDSPFLIAKINEIDGRYRKTYHIGLRWVRAMLDHDLENAAITGQQFFDLQDNLKSLIAQVRIHGLQGFTDSMDHISKQTQTAWSTTLLIFGVGTLCVVLLSIRLYRSMSAPLGDLLKVINDIRGETSKLTQRVEVTSTDEIGQLAATFNAMLEDLEQSDNKIREQMAGLEHTVARRTAQLQREKEALSESERHLKAIWDSTPSGIMVIDAETHHIMDANPFAVQLMGRTLDQVKGHICHSFICPAEKGRCPITDLGKTVDGQYRKLVGVGGNHIDILKTVVPLTKKGQKLLIESFVDITDLKETDLQVRTAMQDAEEANRAKSEFLANMSHELRTPLNHIIGFTELIVDNNFGELNPIQSEYLNDVLASSRHLLSLINDILDISKIEAGKLDLDPVHFNIKSLLDNSLTMIKEKAMKHGLEVNLQFGDLPEYITADKRKLKQIMYNLLSNAVKFTPDGGCITISAQPSESKTNADSPSPESTHPELKIEVADTGIGLTQADMDHIFRPFEQVEHSRSRKFQGTGLGLSLTKSLVELHGGKIWVESDGQHQGSRFSFTLPHSPEPHAHCGMTT